MPKYLIQATYTADGLRGLIKDTANGRREAVRKAIKSVGGKMESVYLSFGKHDIVLIADFPDNATVAGFAAQAGATGLVRLTTTPLLTIEEADKGLKVKANYSAPESAN